MDRLLKVLRNPHKFLCSLEVAVAQEDKHDNVDEHIIRVATTSGKNLLSLSISREIGQHITSALTQAIPSIDIDGNVRAMFEDENQQENQLAAVALDQLIAEAVSSEMLEDEPEALQMLSIFRLRLLKSLELVEQAIAALPKD